MKHKRGCLHAFPHLVAQLQLLSRGQSHCAFHADLSTKRRIHGLLLKHPGLANFGACDPLYLVYAV